MRAHMTNGTSDFLKQIIIKEKKYNFTLAFSETSSNALAYYETEDDSRSVFAAGRSFIVLAKNGQFQEEGYFVMNNIPLATEGMPIFENRFRNKKLHIDQIHGFIAHRILKPLKGDTYVILTQWEQQADYELWLETDHYEHFFAMQAVKQPAYFSSRPYKTYYSFYHEEEDEDLEEQDTKDTDEEKENPIE